MYIPKRYQELDPQTVAAFVRANDFATLVNFDGQRPSATHLLLDLAGEPGGALVLNGHMARANPQWRSFTADQDVLAIFSGPHTYISPRWYNHPNVPTWNYMSVHITGRPRIITDADELLALLTRLVERHEAGSEATPGYHLADLAPDFLAKQMQAIVGFQITIERIEASFKLSQNRDAQSYDTIVQALYQRTDDNSQAVANAMAARREHLFQ